MAYGQWADFFLENYSRPPVRAEKTHATNGRCVKHLKLAFANCRLVDITADAIELYFVTVSANVSESRASAVTGK